MDVNDNDTSAVSEDHVQAPASTIKAIDKGSVHRICSGQVVLTLATAVKELVENSIDAGSTIVEVRLKEYGSEVIEVTDNGSGVEEKNFEGLTLKHHTSKLQDFSDLVNVDTFGFRGEALSSLCALSGLTVVTRHVDVGVGTKLEFDHNGKIISRTPQARQQGTSVTLQNLFSTLPVRHKEFQRNLKKEFAKMVQVLNSYCIISTGVRITCTNQVGKGSKSTVVSSSGNMTMKENISNVFGPKQVQSLLEFVKSRPSEEVTSEYNVKVSDESFNLFEIQGFVSKCEHGQGRSSADRQFYFINQRPCDSTKLSKIVNEVYHQYNRHQYPFVAMHISMAKESVDVNVTPDKRQIFMQDEKLLLAIIKTSLYKMFEPTTSIVQLNLVPASLTSAFQRSNSSNSTMPLGSDLSSGSKLQVSLSKLKRSFSSAFSKEEESLVVSQVGKKNDTCQIPKQRRLDNFLSSSSSSFSSHTVVAEDSPSDTSMHSSENCQQTSPIDCDQESGISSQSTLAASSLSSQDSLLCSSESESVVPQCFVTSSEESCSDLSQVVIHEHTASVDPAVKTYKITGETSTDIENTESRTGTIGESVTCDSDLPVNDTCQSSLMDTESVEDREVLDSIDCNDDQGQSMENIGVTVTQLDEREDMKRRESSVKFSMSALKDKVSISKNRGQDDKEFCRSFRAKISPTDNDAAEEELKREIRKDMFSKMDILGQFNLGFIIVKLGQDLFIVDQHATDEKYNFEMLQQHTVIQNQKLIQPQTLELTASNETILMDNVEVFKKNGFDFITDENGTPTQRVKLTSIPVSKNWTFGKDDIEELIFMLTDSPGVMCRPSRVRQMFASRSCRKSIMIGTALKKSEMKKLVCHMGEIEQPWNCPHGRPTFRHLINLDMVPK